LTPYQALAAGTRNIAAFYGPRYEGGTIAAGRWADLVLLRGNPLQDIRRTARPAAVMVNGRLVYQRSLQEELFYDLRATFDTVVKELVLTNRLPAPEAQLVLLRQGRTAHEAMLKALTDSLGATAESTRTRDTRRMRSLLGRQLDAYRTVLAATPARQEVFDSAARKWVTKRAAEGFRVELPTVRATQ
jgi:adenine deaminase